MSTRPALPLGRPVATAAAALIGASDLDPEEDAALRAHHIARLDAAEMGADAGLRTTALLADCAAAAAGWSMHLDLDVAGVVLVMAARLIHIKSRMLLPRPDPAQEDEDEDPRMALVDRLLASPHWGEHRGRYWLDYARYADTHGIHFDNFREMWTYRDWVINAFNRTWFGGLNTSILSPTYTQLTGQSNRPRNIQLGLKLIF